MRPTTASRVLWRAVSVTGGVDELCAYLGVAVPDLRLWLAGARPVPDQIFLEVVDLIFDPEVQALFGRQQRLGAAAAANPEATAAGRTQLRAGTMVARCPQCDCVEFIEVAPGKRLRCAFCECETPIGDLMVLMGKEAVQACNAAIARLKKRQQQLKTNPWPTAPGDGRSRDTLPGARPEVENKKQRG